MSAAGTARRTGLVLTGGGARGAYQAGVLHGIAELLAARGRDLCPFPILAGVSAGAINAAFLGAQRGSFAHTTELLCRTWRELRTNAVVKTDVFSLGVLSARWVRDLGTGGLVGKGSATHLLDSTPLRAMLSQRVDFAAIRRNIADGVVHGLAVTATNYHTGTAVTFFDGHPGIAPWTRSARLGERVALELDHVLASASIPIFFRPVRMMGSHFGDGGVRMSTPLSPAIHLGADRILAIGIRYVRPESQVDAINREPQPQDISLADIAGVLLNALFLDSLESDLERLVRINQTVDLLSAEQHARHPAKLRKIPVLALRPSKDLGTLAAHQFEKFPAVLRYLLKGTGASRDKGWDMLSYLAFDESYTSLLIDLGHADALAQRDVIEAFFDG